MAGPKLEIGISADVAGAITSVSGLARAMDSAFDQVAAGKAAFDRISASIDEMAAAAVRANQTFEGIGSSAVKAITPLNVLEARLEEIQSAIGRAGTVQRASQLGVEYDIINRTLQETKKQIDQATTAAIGLSRAFATVSTSSGSLNRLAPALKPVLTNLKVLPPAADAASRSLNRLRGSAGSGSAALTDFSRIVQDSPFGLIGIGNNITQLADSFGNLVKSAGGVGPAFKSIFSAATGFGGIALVISAITTALTFASVGFSAWTRGFNSSKKASEEAAEALQKFLEGLKSTQDIIGEATGSVQGQIAQVQALAKVVLNTNGAYDQRKRALQELGQINKNYFGDLKLEASQLGILAARVKEYTDALVAQAVLKGFTDEISRVAPELSKQEAALDVARSRVDRARVAYDQAAAASEKFRNATTVSGGTLGGASVQTNRYAEALASAQGELNDSTEAFNKQRTAVLDIATNMALLKGRIQGAVDATLQFRDLSSDSAAANKKEEDALKARISALKELQSTIGLNVGQQRELIRLEIGLLQRDGVKLNFTPEEVRDQIEEILKTRFGGEPVQFPIVIDAVPQIGKIDVAGVIIPNGILSGAFDKVIEAAKKGATEKQAALRQALRDSLANTVSNGILDAFASIGDTIGAAVAGIFSGNIGEVLAKGGEALLGIIGSTLQEVGKQIIATSALVAALKKALATLFVNPVAGFAVGLGLVALGGFLKNIKFPGFADGTTSFSGGLAVVGERGPELVRLPAGSDVIPNSRLSLNQGNNVTVQGIIYGRDIFLTNQRAAQTNRRI